MNKHDKEHFVDFIKWFFRDFTIFDYAFGAVVLSWGVIAISIVVFDWKIF